ncbi:MAG: hypothetical protein H6964_05655 [Chromatiaceae bacterium]|nr:hypothetical protein [Gammaproteobacteria bacterium]MCP5426650.1 hypothetical protein [Chromatiaceae bacterium]MCB1860534.1 hypothetical protein [Gammaproteobacteria bacterium]MCB1870479.1 hypothetical protein [Gammaproteobacteria bacterium]MCB1879305.1 hypothetical protein [Gammaproteobacteria bacterium]
MMDEYELQRFSAYFRGWCQAFGEHNSLPKGADGISWLLGEDQVGFILPQHMTKPLYREVLRTIEAPLLTLSNCSVRIGNMQIELAAFLDHPAMSAIKSVLESAADSHLYLTSHFMYGPGAKIITLSNKRPLSIIYKEIGHMRVRLIRD